MSGPTKRKGLRVLATLGVVALLAAVTTVPAAATPPVNLTSTLLARGTDLSVGTIPLQAGTDVVVAQITVLPGGSSGWHSHPGGAIVVLQQGALTVYGSVGSQCVSTSYTAGQAFIERPGEVDQVVNTGTIPYVLFVTFPRVPQGGPTRIDQPNPGTCTGV